MFDKQNNYKMALKPSKEGLEIIKKEDQSTASSTYGRPKNSYGKISGKGLSTWTVTPVTLVISARKAGTDFLEMRKLCTSSGITMETVLKLFTAIVLSFLLYISQSEKTRKKLKIFFEYLKAVVR